MKPQAYFTRKPEVSLSDVAANMRADLGRVQWTRRILRGGLELLLERKEGKRYRLACARELTAPSDTELKVLLNAFGLPGTTQWQRHETQRKKGADGRERILLNPLHVAECTFEQEETVPCPSC